jgi:hypothetical protein
MQISGYNYRSFFEQTGLSFNLTASLNNLSGSGEFGFSGQNNKIGFKFNSGRIYDFEDRYVFSYLEDSNFQISGNLDTGSYSYHINNNPVCFNGIKNNFKIKNFYVKTDQNTILDVDLKIYGESPNYDITINDKYLIDSFLTGIINNKSLLDFRIFSGELVSPNQDFSIVTFPNIVSGINKSNIIFQPNTGDGIYNLTLNLYTDFGLVSQDFTTTGIISSLADLVFLLSPNIFLISQEANTPYLLQEPVVVEQTYSFSHEGTNAVGENYYGFNDDFVFEYHSGYLGIVNGNILGVNDLSTGINTGSFYGTGSIEITLTGFNILTGINLTGTNLTSYNPSTGTQFFDISGSGDKFIYLNLTGLGFINYSGIRPLFGDYSSDFIGITGTGLASGYLLNAVAPYKLTGISKIIYPNSAVQVMNGSGIYEFQTSGISGIFTGIANYIEITVTGILSNGTAYPVLQKHYYNNFSGFLSKTEYITGMRPVVFSGIGTGISTGYANTFLTSSGYAIYTGTIINSGYLNEISNGATITTGIYSGDTSRTNNTIIFSGASFTGFRLVSSRYVSDPSAITATGIYFSTGYNIYSENFSNYSGLFYDSSGSLGFGPLGIKNYNFFPSTVERDNLILIGDENPIKISGLYYRLQGTMVTNESTTGTYINKIKKFGNLYYILGDFTLIGQPLNLSTTYLMAVMSGENLDLTPLSIAGTTISYTNPDHAIFSHRPYDCYLEGTGLYVNQQRLPYINRPNSISRDPLWNPKLCLPGNYTFSAGSTSVTSNKAEIFGIFPESGEAGKNLYMIGNFSTTENLHENIEEETYFKFKDSKFLYNRIIKIDKVSGRAVPEDSYRLDHIGQKGFKKFTINDKDESTNIFSDFNENIYCYYQTGNKLYLGGSFNMVGDVFRGGFAVYNKSGALEPVDISVTTFGSPAGRDINHSINTAVSTGNHLFLGGSISTFGGIRKYENGAFTYPEAICLIKLKNPINTNRTFLPVKIYDSYLQAAEMKDVKKYNNNIYAIGRFNQSLRITGEGVSYASSQIYNPYERTGIQILTEAGNINKNKIYNLIGAGTNTISNSYGNILFITGSTGYFGGNFTGLNINGLSEKKHNFVAVDLNTDTILPYNYDNAEGEIFSIKHFNQDWIESKNEFDQNAEIIEDKLNTIIVLGSFDTLYSGYAGNTTTNRWYPDPNGLLFIDANNPSIRYSGLRTGMRVIKYLSSGVISTGNNFENFNHRDIVRLKNYNLNNTFDFIYGTGMNYEYSSTTYNDYGEIRFKTLNDIATYINNPNSLTISSPPNWSNLYNNFTGILNPNSLTIRYKISGNHSGDFPFISLEHIGLGLFEKTFSVSQNNNITGEVDPTPAITKKYIGDFCAITRTGEILVVGNSNWKNQNTNIPSGAAYIYKNQNNNFQLVKILSGSGHGSQGFYSYYGFNGDINHDGSTIAIGAKNFHANRIAANIFQTTGIVDIYTGKDYNWDLQQRLSGNFSGLGTGNVAASYFSGRDFGKTLSLDYFGNRIAISDVLKRNNETGSNIHIFQKINNNQWGLENIINLSPYDIYDVKLNDYGNILALGQSTGLGGNIKIITKTGIDWSTALTGEISSENPNNQIYLGASIDMNSIGNVIVAGAPNAINNNINCGAVFVYTGMNTNWSQVAKITGNNLVAGERFGHSVSINKDATIMSIFSKNADTGKAYIFTGFASTWKQYQEITGFSGAWVGITGDYIRPDRLINKNIKINGSGNLLLIGDTLSGIVKSFSLPYQSKPSINQFDGGYQERYITFRYPTSNKINNDFYGYEKLNNNYYYLYGSILDYSQSVNGPWINGVFTNFIGSLANYVNSGSSIILINNTGGWETGFFPLFGDGANSNNVNTAKVYKNKLYVGGNFTKVSKYIDITRDISRLVCLDTGNGNILNPFSGTVLNGDVNDINIWKDYLLIVGNFNTDFNIKVNLSKMLVADESGKFYTSYNFNQGNNPILKTYIDENDEIYVMGRSSSISNTTSKLFYPSIFSRNSGNTNVDYPLNSTLPIICLNKTPSGYEIPYNDFNKNLPIIANTASISNLSQIGSNTTSNYISKIITGESGFYIGGSFNNINGIARNNIALIGYDGSLKEWAPVFDGPIYDMVKSGDQLFVAGDFSDVNNGWGTSNIVQIKSTGKGNDIADINQIFSPIIDTTNGFSLIKIISKIFLESGYIYIGGTFKTVNSPAITKLAFAAFDQGGNHVPELTKNISIDVNPAYSTSALAEVRSIEKINDIFLLGGYFDSVNGKNITDFVPIKQDGTIVDFPSGLIARNGRTLTNESIISDIKVTGNYVYLIGPSLSWFTNKNNTFGGGRLGGACRLIYTENKFIIDKNWMPSFELFQTSSFYGKYSPRKMLLDDQENAYIFGNFRKAGYFRPGICELENGEITNFNPLMDLPNSNNFVKEIQSYDNDHIIIGGSFQNFGTTGNISGITGRNSLAVININNSELNSWNANLSSNSEIRTILVDQQKDQIHIGGVFNQVNSKPFDNIITLSHQSGSKIKMRPYITNNDKDSSNIFVNSIIKKDNNSLLIGGKIGNIASYIDVSGEGILSSGTGLYNDYIPIATGMTFVSGLYTGLLTHTGLNQKNITGNFLFLNNINYASGSIFTGISGSILTPRIDSFINNIIISNATNGGNSNYQRLNGGYTQFSGSSEYFIRYYSGNLNSWLLYDKNSFNTGDALYKSNDLITWQSYTKIWDGSVFIGYSDYYYTGFKPDDLFILSHRNSSSVWPFVFGTGINFQYSSSSSNYLDNKRSIRFDSLTGLNKHINETNFQNNYNNIYNYYTGRIINDQSGERLIITAKSTGSNYPNTNLYYYGSGNPMISQLSGENDNQYIKTNLISLSGQNFLTTSKIFTPLTGIQTFSIPVLTGYINLSVSSVTGLWLSTGRIDETRDVNMLSSYSGFYSYTGNFTGLPTTSRLIGRSDSNLVPLNPFTGYSNSRVLVNGLQTGYINSGEIYKISINDNKFSGEFLTTGLISGTATGTTPDGYIDNIVTGVPYFFTNNFLSSGINLIPNKNIFTGQYSNLITGIGQVSGGYFYTGLTGIYLTGTGVGSFISSGIITGTLSKYNPIFNQSFAQEIFSSGIYENKFTGTYYEVIITSGLNGPFYGTGFLSQGIMPNMELYEKTFSGAFEVQTGNFLDSSLQPLDPDDPYTYSTQIQVLRASDVPISINIKYKSNYDKLDLVGKLTLFNQAAGKLITQYITGVIT